MVLGADYPLMPFMFDTQLNTTGDTMLGLKFKNINVVNAIYTNANCALEWTEKFYCAPETAITSVVDAVVNVADITKLRGVSTDSQVLISNPATGASEVVKVVSIVSNAVTVTPAPTVTAGVLSRLQYTAAGTACNANATNRYTAITEGVYKSPFRRLWLTMAFTQCQLTLHRAGYSDPARAFVDGLVADASYGAREEFSGIFYMDAGWDITDASNINTNKTLGIIPGIQKAQTTTGKNLVHDFSLVCEECEGLTDCEKDQAMVAAFYDVLMEMHKTGLYNNEPITLLANVEAYNAIQKLQPAFADYHQITVVYNADSKFKSIYSSLNMIQLPFGAIGTVDIYLDQWLDRFKLPFMIGLPANRVFVTQRPFIAAEAKDNGTVALMNNSLSNGNPRFKFIDRSIIEGDGTGECTTLKAFMDLGIVPQGMFSGAYRILSNLKSCTTLCNPLLTNTTPELETFVITH
jgi:hypothetical protein